MGMISSLLVFQLGQARVWFAMSRDGLLPRIFSRVHPKYQTPDFSTWLAGFVVGIPAGLLDIGTLADLSNIGTLFAFALVAAGVLILRYREPDRPRAFRAPGGPIGSGDDHPYVLAADGRIADHELDPVLYLADYRPGDLLFLWPEKSTLRLSDRPSEDFPGLLRRIKTRGTVERRVYSCWPRERHFALPFRVSAWGEQRATAGGESSRGGFPAL